MGRDAWKQNQLSHMTSVSGQQFFPASQSFTTIITTKEAADMQERSFATAK